MNQEAKNSGRWWSNWRVLVIVTLFSLVSLVVLAVVAGSWLRQRRIDKQEAICWRNMGQTLGAWCDWSSFTFGGPRREGPGPAPTWQDLDSRIYGGYRALKCPAGGRYHLSDDPPSDHGDLVTCTVHGKLLRTYPGSERSPPGVRLLPNGPSD